MPDGWSVLFTCRIQIPRIFNVYASLGMLSNWGEMLDNIFRPLFAVSCDPDSDPLLDSFLQHVSGIDSVDDERRIASTFSAESTCADRHACIPPRTASPPWRPYSRWSRAARDRRSGWR